MRLLPRSGEARGPFGRRLVGVCGDALDADLLRGRM
jgi:hypothetical protein